MKNIKIINKLILAIIATSIISCNNEPLDPSINLKASAVIPVTNPTNPSVNPIIKNPSGDYYPLIKNNNWNFYNGTVTKNLKITAVETFNNFDYCKVNKNFFMTNQMVYQDADYTTHFRKKDGKYYQRIFINRPEVYTAASGSGSTFVPESSVPGIVVQPYEIMFLKEDLVLNVPFPLPRVQIYKTTSTTRTILFNSVPTLNTANLNTTENIDVTLTLVEVTANAIVNGYPTTILKIKTEIAGIPGFQYNWFAKDIGLIEQTNVNAIGTVTDYFKLTAFTFF
jgi:hypothetical protein